MSTRIFCDRCDKRIEGNGIFTPIVKLKFERYEDSLEESKVWEICYDCFEKGRTESFY